MITKEEALNNLKELMNIPNIMELRHPNLIVLFGKLERYITQQTTPQEVEEALNFINKDAQIHLVRYNKIWKIINKSLKSQHHTPNLDQLKNEIIEYDVLQYFADLSRGKIFEYRDIKIFYNNEFETYALNDERNKISVKTVYNILKEIKVINND